MMTMTAAAAPHGMMTATMTTTPHGMMTVTMTPTQCKDSDHDAYAAQQPQLQHHTQHKDGDGDPHMVQRW